MKRMTCLVFLAALFACGGDRYAPYQASTVPTKATAEQAYKAALTTVVDVGYTPETKDADAGLIVTKWENDTGVMGNTNRYRWRISVTASAVNVASQCQTLVTKNWRDCGEKQPRKRLDATRALADRIAAALHR